MGIQPIFALLDDAARGANLEIRESGLVLTCNQPGVSGGSRMKCRGTIPKTAGTWMFEVAYWGDDSATGGLIAVGICTQASTLNSGAGVDANSYALMMADGGIWSNGAQLTATQAIGKQQYVQVVVDLTNNVMKFYRSSPMPFATQAITPATGGRMYYPCVTVGSDAASSTSDGAYGLSAYINFGQRAFSTPLAQALGIKGWYAVSAAPPPKYFGPAATSAYASGSADTPANQVYAQCLTDLDQIEITQTATIWTQATADSDTLGSASATYSSLTFDNSMGEAQDLIDRADAYRYAPVYFRQLLDRSKTLTASATTIATCVVDNITAPDENTVVVSLKDKLQLDSVPLQQRIFPPWADPGVAGRTYPKVIGAVRSFPVGDFLVDQTNRIFQLGDANTYIGVLRDKGMPLTGTQYVQTPDLQGVVPIKLPDGLFTSDLGSIGTTSAYPGAADVLNGSGSNWDTAWLSGPAPTGWAVTNTDPGADSSAVNRQTGISTPPHTFAQLASKRQLSDIGTTELSLHTTTQPLKAGKRYSIAFNIGDFQDPNASPSAGLCVLSSMASATNPFNWISPRLVPLQGGFHADVPITLLYDVPAGADRDLYFTIAGVGTGGQVCTASIRNVTISEIPTAAVDVPLQGSTWRNYFGILYSGMAAGEWSTADLDALDALYPSQQGGPLGIALVDPGVTLLAAANAAMSSIAGVVQIDRGGMRRFCRWTDPAGRVPAATYNESDILYGVVVDADLAPGLTLSVGSQHNYKPHGDSDLVTDTDLVPPALRTQLKRDFRVIQTANLQLANPYQFARMAQPLSTIFDDSTIALNELLRCLRPYSPTAAIANGGVSLGTAYRTPRWLTFSVNYTGLPPEHLFGTAVGVNYTSKRSNGSTFRVNQNVAVFETSLFPCRHVLTIKGLG